MVAYSGALATSIAIPWLKERDYTEVIAVALDLGQGRELSQIRERAIAAGAIRCHVLDVREEFARDFLLRALQAGAMQDPYPAGAALESPLVAKKLVDIAHMEYATAIAHGSTDNGPDGGRLDVAIRAIAPAFTVIAPALTWTMSVQEQTEYARARNLPLSSRTGPYRVHQNVWGRAIECDALGDLWKEAPDDLFTLTKPPEHGPGIPAYAEIEWEAGVPVSINGVAMPLTDLLDSLETIAGAHGVGRVDDRLTGAGSREVYETPAGVVLYASHRALEGLVISKDLRRLKGRLSKEYADIIDTGSWFSLTREALDAFMLRIQQRVTGVVRMKLYKGSCHAVGVQSAFALAKPATGLAPAVK